MNLRSCFTFIFILLLLPSTIFAGTLYVVVSNNLKEHSFTAAEVKRILLGEISTVNHSRIHLIYPSYSSQQIETLSQYVGKGKGSRNLKSYWSKMIFTGRGTPPMIADDSAELKQMLSKDNSIGVSTEKDGMNVIQTINE